MRPALSLDFETKDPYIGRGLGAGWVYAINYPELADFFPIGYAYNLVDLDTMKPITTIRYQKLSNESLLDAKNNSTDLAHLIAENNVMIAHNASYELGTLLALGIDVDHLEVYDTKLIAKLYDNTLFSYSLEPLSNKYCPYKAKQANLLELIVLHHKLLKTKNGKDKRTDTKAFPAAARKFAYNNMPLMQKLEPEIVADYAKYDIVATNELLKIFFKTLSKKEKDIAVKLGKVTKICVKIRTKGIDVDLVRLQENKLQLETDMTRLRQELSLALSIPEADLTSTKKVSFALNKMGYELKISEAGNYQINKKSLAGIKNDPIINNLLEFKSLCTLYNSFVNKILEMQVYTCPIPMKYGKVFPELNVLGASTTGRFSSSNPNGQNIPKRSSQYGLLIRSMFVPSKGKEWIACDWSNQEGRLQIHDAVRLRLTGAFAWQKRFQENPNLDIHKLVAEMMYKVKSPDEDQEGYKVWKDRYRTPAKTIYLGKSYCMGKASTAKSLGLPAEYETISYHGKQKKFLTAGKEAMKLIRAYDNAFPFLSELQDRCKQFLTKNGYIPTLMGRKCKAQIDFKTGRSLEYKAISFRIQGSAADQMIEALLLADEAGLDILMLVHDEICIQGNKEEGEVLKNIMENCIKLNIPVVAELTIGKNWGNI